MWHAHMQDNQAYKIDSNRLLHRVLNHIDDFTPEELNQHQQNTSKIREGLFPMAAQQTNYVDDYPGYAYIYYGGGVCGAGGWE